MVHGCKDRLHSLGLREFVKLLAAMNPSQLEDQRKADLGTVLHDILDIRRLVVSTGDQKLSATRPQAQIDCASDVPLVWQPCGDSGRYSRGG